MLKNTETNKNEDEMGGFLIHLGTTLKYFMKGQHNNSYEIRHISYCNEATFESYLLGPLV